MSSSKNDPERDFTTSVYLSEAPPLLGSYKLYFDKGKGEGGELNQRESESGKQFTKLG